MSLSKVGMNVNGLVDYARDVMPSNLIWAAREWGDPKAPWTLHTDPKLNEHGFPTVDFGLCIMADREASAQGNYTLTVTGVDDLELVPIASKVTVLEKTNFLNQSTGNGVRWKLNIGVNNTVDNLVGLSLTFKNIKGSIRDMELRKNDAGSGYFTEKFIERTKPFGGLRFMDSQKTNRRGQNSTLLKLSDIQILPKDPVWRQKGMPVWYALAHSAIENQDVYVTLDDRLVPQDFQEYANQMNKYYTGNNRVFIERGNELWNSQFGQMQDNLARAKADASVNDPKYAGIIKNNDYYKLWAFTADQTYQLAQAFKAFPKFNVVLPIQFSYGNQYVLRVMIDFLKAKYGNLGNIKYVSGAPYWGTDQIKNITKDTTPKQIVDLLSVSAKNLISSEVFKGYPKLLRDNGLKMVCYECGIDLTGGGVNDPAILDKIVQAQSLPGIMDSYKIVFDAYFGWGDIADTAFMYTFAGRPQSTGVGVMFTDVYQDSQKWIEAQPIIAAYTNFPIPPSNKKISKVVVYYTDGTTEEVKPIS